MQFLGLDIDGPVANLALLNSQKKLIEVKAFDVSNVKQLYIRKEKISKSTSITSALDARHVIIREKNIKARSKNAIKKAIPFQLKSCTSIPYEQLLCQSLITTREKKSSSLYFYLTTKKTLKNHLDALGEIEIDPDFVSSQSQALNRFAFYHFPDVKELFILHIGKEQTTLAYVKEGVVSGHHGTICGINALFNSYSKDPIDKNFDYNKINFSKISRRNQPLLFEAIDSLENEIKKALLSFLPIAEEKKIPLLITGQVNVLKNFEEYILSKFPEIVSESLRVEETSQLPFAISIGLGLDTLIKDKGTLQFRQNEFIPIRHLKKAATSLCLFFISSIALSVLLFFVTSKIYKGKEEALLTYLSAIEKTENLPLSTLPFSSIDSRVTQLTDKIKNESKKSPYICSTPKVCHLLEWISNHPLINEEDSESLETISIDYELVDSPSAENPKKPYSAKAKLTLKIKDPEVAAKFHESLTKSCSLIDTSKEISWEEGNTRSIYNASFYLKNKPLEGLYDY